MISEYMVSFRVRRYVSPPFENFDVRVCVRVSVVVRVPTQG